MRGKGTDINIKKMVLEEKINNISMSSRDICAKLKEQGIEVSHDTVCDILNEDLPQVATESKSIADLIDRNNSLLSMADRRLQSMIENWEENIRASELVAVRESAFKQNQLLQGKPTDNIAVISDIQIS